MLSYGRTTTLFSASIFLVGCASTQLNFNARDLAGSIDDLLTHQVIDNLERFLVDSTANPAQVSIASGSVTTTNQASISASNPINRAVTATEQFSTAAGAVIPAVTTISSGVAAATTLTPSLNNQASQNWSLATDTDSDQERRLRALYRYVTKPTSSSELCSEYPVLSTQASVLAIDGKTTATSMDTENGPITLTAMDAQFLKEPGCIICSDKANAKNINSIPHDNYCKVTKQGRPVGDLYINPRLKNNWLYHTPVPVSDPSLYGLTYLGIYPDTVVYTKDKEQFRQFVLFVLEATNLGSTAGQSGKAGPSVKPQGSTTPAGAQLLLSQ